MRVDFDPKAREELENLKKEHRAFVLTRIEELQENPTSHENSGLIRVGGRQVFKYVMKEGSKGGKDYRAVYDVEGQSVKIFAVFHRDEGYDKQLLDDRL
jgi:mRNA-degrading endonuclease RelE of RelBE toxin-antitoxin system